jgi:hypothetical protein
MKSFHAALVETASNQGYIFQSNKLREVLGASELVRQAGTDFADAALKEGGFSGAHEKIIATSGKAVVLFDKREDAETFIFRVTRHALRDAPGLGVFGAVSERLDADASAKEAADLMRGLFKRAGRNRLGLTDPSSRFPFQPVVLPCATSGLPAEQRERGDAISAMARAKRLAAKNAETRLHDVFNGVAQVAYSPDDLEKANCAWFGIIHADGNGFGEIFLNLDRYAPEGGNAAGYFAFYKRLSEALDEIGKQATSNAAESLCKAMLAAEPDEARRKKLRLPLMPLVMGGDDLTVIVDGARAVDFVREYASQFEQLVDKNLCIAGIRERKGKRFGVGAGIAIVKPHHPFHRAYDLAEELIKSAKTTKARLGPGASSFDFHIAFSDSSSDLATLRGAWLTDDGQTSLTARPYVMSKPERFEGGHDKERAEEWAKAHAVESLDAARRQLALKRQKDGDEAPAFPRSQQHVLRDSLFEGQAAADARLDLIRHRYAKSAERKDGVDFAVFGAEKSLFFGDSGISVEHKMSTRLLDAMELNDVCGEPEDASAKSGSAAQ